MQQELEKIERIHSSFNFAPRYKLFIFAKKKGTMTTTEKLEFKLGFDKVRTMLATRCSTSYAKEMALSFKISSSSEYIVKLFQTDGDESHIDARKLISRLGGFVDATLFKTIRG